MAKRVKYRKFPLSKIIITGATASMQQLQQRRDDCPDKKRKRSKENKQKQAPSASQARPSIQPSPPAHTHE